MAPLPGLDPSLVSELEILIGKLAKGPATQTFTMREQELMERLRASRHVILPQLHAILEQHVGVNDAGKAKIETLIDAVEKICAASN